MNSLWTSLRRRAGGAALPAAQPVPSALAVHTLAQRVFWAWALAAGVVVFIAWWLHTRGMWVALVQGDPSGISVGIVVLSVLVTGWCGWRARRLAQQAQAGSSWRSTWQTERQQLPDHAGALLSERLQGPHETAWWFAAATIKLGLLGTVVGFIVMAAQIGRMPSFDLDQVQNMLKQMTSGMAIALYTTLVGLLANLWLGLQLLLLDRLSDRLAADIIASSGPPQE